MDTSNPSEPKIMHAFMPRDPPGYSIKQTWDVLGMRATRSDDTTLENVFVPDRYVARVVPAGAAGIDPFVLGVFAWALMGFGNVYCGLAKRALDLSTSSVKSKGSLSPVPWRITLRSNTPLPIWSSNSNPSGRIWRRSPRTGPTAWIMAPFGPQRFLPPSTVPSKAPVESWTWGLGVTGGNGIFSSAGYERLVRDACLGRIHPANSFLTHEVVAKTVLGISLDEQPRWGWRIFLLPAVQPLATNFSLNFRMVGWDWTKSQH